MLIILKQWLNLFKILGTFSHFMAFWIFKSRPISRLSITLFSEMALGFFWYCNEVTSSGKKWWSNFLKKLATFLANNLNSSKMDSLGFQRGQVTFNGLKYRNAVVGLSVSVIHINCYGFGNGHNQSSPL